MSFLPLAIRVISRFARNLPTCKVAKIMGAYARLRGSLIGKWGVNQTHVARALTGFTCSYLHTRHSHAPSSVGRAKREITLIEEE